MLVLHSFHCGIFERYVTADAGSWIQIGAAGETAVYSLLSLEAAELPGLRTLALDTGFFVLLGTVDPVDLLVSVVGLAPASAQLAARTSGLFVVVVDESGPHFVPCRVLASAVTAAAGTRLWAG